MTVEFLPKPEPNEHEPTVGHGGPPVGGQSARPIHADHLEAQPLPVYLAEEELSIVGALATFIPQDALSPGGYTRPR